MLFGPLYATRSLMLVQHVPSSRGVPGASTTGTNARGLQKAHAPSAASLGVARGSADAVESQKVGMGDAKELAV